MNEFKRDSKKTVSLLLSFAGGVMTAIVCFDLIISAINTKTNVFVISLGICAGVLVVYLLNFIIDRRTNHEVHHINTNHPQTADDLDELIHSNHLSAHIEKKDTRFSLFIAGLIMACAIALHNVPEGMTIGASFVNSGSALEGSALVLAVLIGLHNIPEGMAISVPLINGGIKRRGLALSLSFASGAMLYVTFGEIIPQSILMYRSKLPAFFVIIGILVGLIVIYT